MVLMRFITRTEPNKPTFNECDNIERTLRLFVKSHTLGKQTNKQKIRIPLKASNKRKW